MIYEEEDPSSDRGRSLTAADGGVVGSGQPNQNFSAVDYGAEKKAEEEDAAAARGEEGKSPAGAGREGTHEATTTTATTEGAPEVKA